ncbi:DNA repair protein spr18 [Pseudozyma hubeiensis]|nr:DNA repair protein spr18 [Pseudozyma hubeiensis]
MSEATQTLSNLVKTFSGSSGSLSLHSSPYKKNETPDHRMNTGTPRDLYGIMEADESGTARTSPLHRLPSSTRQRLISIASMVSTEANSSFEDSEELQKLLDSIMAADLGGGSYDTSGSRDMALLSPFGSPAEYRNVQHVDTGSSSGGKDKESPKPTSTMPAPPKFLLNDRPISPPDSSCTSDATHSTCAPASLVHVRSYSWSRKAVAGRTPSVPDDSGYVSVSGLDTVGIDAQR